MDWADIGGIAFSAVASVGGIGVIIAACARLASDQIANRMLEKYKADLTKEIEHYKRDLNQEAEKYKVELERLTFVTQRQFDTEFAAYQALFDSLFDFSVNTASLYPLLDQLPPDSEKRKEEYKKRYEKYCAAFNRYSETLEKNAPFIPKENYKIFSDLRAKANEIGCMYPEVRILDDPIFAEDNREMAREGFQNTRQFNDDIAAAKDSIRDYLATLKVDK